MPEEQKVSPAVALQGCGAAMVMAGCGIMLLIAIVLFFSFFIVFI